MAPNQTRNTGLPQANFTMEQFDALPKPVRLAYSEHPLNVCPTEYGLEIMKRVGPKQFARDIQERVPELLRIAAINTYGPDHPQAQ